MSKRLQTLEKMLASGTTDPFVRYAYAMELKSLGRLEESLSVFENLREYDASYVPQYLLAGQVAEALEHFDAARTWYQQGIESARAKGDSHALSELQQALELLESTHSQ